MSAKASMAIAVLAALALLAGCRAERADRLGESEFRLSRGHGAHLFGPTPLPVGQEDAGYFVAVPPGPDHAYLYGDRWAYVRTRIWDVENNRRGDLSYHRRRVFSDQVRLSYR